MGETVKTGSLEEGLPLAAAKVFVKVVCRGWYL